jgi:hypothetical protein
MMRLTLAALRNYASPVIARDNPLIINVVIFSGMQFVTWPLLAHRIARQGLRAGLEAGHSDLFWWWILAYMLPACIALHFYRQVRADISPAIPRFMAAERAAASLVFLMALGVLAAPLIVVGAPPAGALGLAAAGMVMGGAGGSFSNTGASKLKRSLVLLFYVPVMILGFTPHGLTGIVFLPTPLAAGLAIACTGALLFELGFRPAHAQVQETARDTAADTIATRAAERSQGQHPAAQRIAAFLAWRPASSPRSPLPTMFGQYLGLPAVVLAIAVQIVFLLGFMVGITMLVGHESFARALHEVGPQALGYAPLIGNIGATQWLVTRGEWPYLFSAGLYGPRASFAQALFNAYRHRSVEQAVFAAPLVTATAFALHLITAAQVPLLIFIIAGLSLGSAYAGAIPLLFNDLGGKAANIFCNFIGTFAGIFAISIPLETHHLLPGLLAATAGLALAITLARLAPTRLARLDWPLETEPEVGG